MDLRQLEYFVTVADEASFTRAAAKLHVAQPGVSAQVRRLEAELGHMLLDRSGRTVCLTEVGRTVIPLARAALGAAAGVRQAVDELVGLVRGRVAVGMIASCTVFDLPELLASFHQRYPAVDITLSEDSSDALVADVRDGALDIALVGFGTSPPSGLDVLEVAEQRLVAAVPHDHPLASEPSVSLKELSTYPLIALPQGSAMRAVIDAACATLDFQLHVAFEASDPLVLTQLAARGLGVAIVPRIVADANHYVQPVSISGSALSIVRVALAWRSDGSCGPTALALIRHARESAAARPSSEMS